MKYGYGVWVFVSCMQVLAFAHAFPEDKVRGMLVGSFIGDAAGGPFEFQAQLLDVADRQMLWVPETPLTEAMLSVVAQKFALQPYRHRPSPLGVWTDNAPIGSITDDSRHKLWFLQYLQTNPTRLTKPSLGRWYRQLCQRDDMQGLYARGMCEAVLCRVSDRAEALAKVPVDPDDIARAHHPHILPQLAFLPLAGLNTEVEKIYELSHAINVFDRQDNPTTQMDESAGSYILASINSLLHALMYEEIKTISYAKIRQYLLETEKIQKTPEPNHAVQRIVMLVDEVIALGEGNPQKTLRILESRLSQYTDDDGMMTWWEPWVPLSVALTALQLAELDPIAALYLSIAFGHDTDTYAQLTGAIVGAMYGVQVFDRKDLIAPVMRAVESEKAGMSLDEMVFILRQASFAE